MIPWNVNVFSMVAAIRNRKKLLLLLLLLVERNRAAANGVAHDTDNASKLRLLYLPQADVKSASRRVASRNSIEVMDPSAATR